MVIDCAMDRKEVKEFSDMLFQRGMAIASDDDLKEIDY